MMQRCENKRQTRLIEVYEHLRKYYGVHTKTDFAEYLRYSRTAISAALNGNERYLTDRLFKTIYQACKGVFNLDYLLTGNGSLLTIPEEVQTDEIENKRKESPESDMIEILAKMIRNLDDLRQEVKKELAELRTVRQELAAARDDFRNATKITMRYQTPDDTPVMAAEKTQK